MGQLTESSCLSPIAEAIKLPTSQLLHGRAYSAVPFGLVAVLPLRLLRPTPMWCYSCIDSSPCMYWCSSRSLIKGILLSCALPLQRASPPSGTVLTPSTRNDARAARWTTVAGRSERYRQMPPCKRGFPLEAWKGHQRRHWSDNLGGFLVVVGAPPRIRRCKITREHSEVRSVLPRPLRQHARTSAARVASCTPSLQLAGRICPATSHPAYSPDEPRPLPRAFSRVLPKCDGCSGRPHHCRTSSGRGLDHSSAAAGARPRAAFRTCHHASRKQRC
ncbi:hypothetical protein C8Q76DRAFT_69177 [Earliella scabrosa]|nr:hypothetical protein C8Q76DRAFT_69177 [Earliella scabrosa]